MKLGLLAPLIAGLFVLCACSGPFGTLSDLDEDSSGGSAFLLEAAPGLLTPWKEGPKPARSHLFSVSSEGYDKLAHIRTVWDAAVNETVTMGGKSCALREPLAASGTAKEPWAPLHLYKNVPLAELEEGKNEAELEDIAKDHPEKEIYFTGDTRGRNGKNQSFVRTSPVAQEIKDSLELSKAKSKLPGVAYRLKFTRGTLTNDAGDPYTALVVVVPRLIEKECAARVWLCTKEKDGECAEGGWTKQVEGLVATADVIAGGWDNLRGIIKGNDRNDIQKLELLYREIDAKGTPTGAQKREAIATK